MRERALSLVTLIRPRPIDVTGTLFRRMNLVRFSTSPPPLGCLVWFLLPSRNSVSPWVGGNAGQIRQLAWSTDSEVLAVVMGPSTDGASQDRQRGPELKQDPASQDRQPAGEEGVLPASDIKQEQGGKSIDRELNEGVVGCKEGEEVASWRVGLWVRSNWHWYLKMELSVCLQPTEGLLVEWDPSCPLYLHMCTREGRFRSVPPPCHCAPPCPLRGGSPVRVYLGKGFGGHTFLWFPPLASPPLPSPPLHLLRWSIPARALDG
jgi:IKI3 family